MSVFSPRLERVRAALTSGTGEPFPARIFTVILGLLFLALLAVNGDQLLTGVRLEWANLLFWSFLIFSVNLLPLTLGEITLTLDMPILMAVALLYPPAVGGLVGLVAAIDRREVERTVPFLRAVFNRFQVGLSVLAASFTFHQVAGAEDQVPQAVAATGAAVVSFHVTNVLLVNGYTWLRIRAWNPVTVGGVGPFLLTYFGYGVLALVYARLFLDVGAWSVIVLVIPILVAREGLVRAQRLQSLADDLRHRERLLERLFDRIVDERRDERARIGAELHDEVLQSLVRISQLAHFIRADTPQESRSRVDAEEVVSASQQAMSQLRQVVADLRTSPLGRGGLVPSLRSLSKDLQFDWRIPITINTPNTLRVHGEHELVLYQVAREAIMNSLKHANPSEITVTLGESGTDVYVEVTDNGIGFDPDAVDSSRHFGLGLMRQRVKHQDGRLVLSSQKQRGTSLSVSLPLESTQKDSSALRTTRQA